MTPYQLFGMELSPYAVKVRAALRHKAVAHQWLPRSKRNEPAFRAHAKLPLIPLLVLPDEQRGLQDSTPILEWLEQAHPTPALTLPDPLLHALACALEESADEWTVKAMFHYRWHDTVDRTQAGLRIARASVDPGTDPAPFAQLIGGHLMTRLPTLGCTDGNQPALEAYLATGAERLNRHLQGRAYLFGGQLSMADLGLGAMYYQLFSDPTPRRLLQDHHALFDWSLRCMSPTDHGPCEPWDQLRDTLLPVLNHELRDHYLPFAQANRQAFEAGDEQLTVRLAERDFVQPVQKYTVKSWQSLQAKLQALPAAARTLLETDLPWLT